MPRLIGGPHDKGDLSFDDEDEFFEANRTICWVDAEGAPHRDPGPGRVAYRWRGIGWTFDGHGARRCGCGADVAPDPATGAAAAACPICGADL